MRGAWAVGVVAALLAAPPASAASPTGATEPCFVSGIRSEVRCGQVRRPLDPGRPDGVQIDVHYVVVPALARRKAPEPLFFIAGGPGQSAIGAAGSVLPLLQRLGNRRDLVFVDQRGTGRSAPLDCGDAGRQPLAERADPQRAVQRVLDCLAQLQRLPHGDLRFYTTPLAAADLDAVRQRLGAARADVIGVSYGTRVALEWMRQAPAAVRRVLLDGVAPADMALPRSFSVDNQAALDAWLAACEAESACRTAHPTLRADWAALLARTPFAATVADPQTGQAQPLTITRELLLGAVRSPLYAPAQAAALPGALAAAAAGRFEPLLALAAALAPGRSLALATGMHFSVICSEDLSRPAAEPPGAQFGNLFAQSYEQVCARWPRGTLPEGFTTLPAAASAVLLASGGLDPATPPRHAERVAAALGAKARHVVVPNAGHGVFAIGCMRDVAFRFFDADDDDAALKVDAACVTSIPRPAAFVAPRP